MLQDEFTSVSQAKGRDELRMKVVGFARRLGFQTVSAMVVIDHSQSESDFITLHNTPAGYCDAFLDLDNGRRDPVMQHCKRSSTPIVWDQRTYTTAGQGDKWEEQARFGYRTGIALALHLPGGRHFMMGVDRDQPLPSSPADVTRLTAELSLFTVCAQDAALRVLLPEEPQPDPPALTSRELESLRWTMAGKTAWEMGGILGISEQTAVRHVNNAAHKLGCVSKHQAVLKALRMQLIR